MYTIYKLSIYSIHFREYGLYPDWSEVMEIYRLKKPDISGRMEKNIDLIYNVDVNESILPYIEKVNSPEYLFWDKVRYKARPKGMSAEDFWAAIKFLRRLATNREQTIIQDEKRTIFTWQSFPGLNSQLQTNS